jgi:hypothetical protein
MVRGKARRKTPKKAAKAVKANRKAAKKASRAPKRAAKKAKKASKRSAKAAKVRMPARRTVKPAKRTAKAAKRAMKPAPVRPSTAKAKVKSAQPPLAQAGRGKPAKPRAEETTATSSAVKAAPRRAPGLDRERRTIRDENATLPSPPSTLDMDRTASAVRSGRHELAERLRKHTSTGPALTGGDVDADWEDAESVGDAAPGGDNPSPDQDVVDEIGQALGITYEDNEELKGGDELAERDRHRWELDPASREDYNEED